MAVKRTNKMSVLLKHECDVRDDMLKYGFKGCKRASSPSPGGKVSARDCPSGDPKDNTAAPRFR